ncbi:hypothetical protein BDQ12DRAFT_697788 [Crucibulum laeve]|uniref:Uncharacterized protein n=1 Tax=Crucibulum laeve TaxID=68775 RepID=A0A5C3M549_9AGAR|nr:hypothetical protein BDQ12DRAFT_697788 [Crucibulum laeve]
MATPSSSATSPSPPMAYLSHAPGPLQQPPSTQNDAHEREHRKKAVQKFLARAEISMVTRALRARLSYASYKATHNIPHVPLRDLEAQSQSQSQSTSFTRTIAAKRKAAGASNYYNNPATQTSNQTGAGAAPQRRGSMAPPSSISSPRTHYSQAQTIASSSAAGNESSSSRTPGSAPSLYASILAPPPTKHARTIHNASDPPVPAPSRPAPSPRMRTVKASPRTTADSSRGHGKSKAKAAATAAAAASPDRKRKRATQDKGKQKEKHHRKHASMDVDVDGDVDMKAAATLTSLLLHHRPSIAGSAGSPRSSIDGSETGSAYSYSHFAQSSARTTTSAAPNPAHVGNSPASQQAHPMPSGEGSFRNHTPPPATQQQQMQMQMQMQQQYQQHHLQPQQQQHQQRPAPTDNEAADLMLFLATSPSPARTSAKDSRDQAAYRVLGGGPEALRSKGRVLFPSSGPGEPSIILADDPRANAARGPSALSRGGESSFNSSISSIGGELGGNSGSQRAGELSAVPRPSSAGSAASSSAPGQLLPPPQLPGASNLSAVPLSPARKEMPRSPKPAIFPQAQAEFNFNEYINSSPSPSRGTVGQGHKTNIGLRADVGRKLFEEEQMRQAMAAQPGKGRDERGLGAGINLQS